MNLRARAGIVAALLSVRAVAAPSLWDRIRDPAGARAASALNVAVRTRMPMDIPVEALPAFDALLSARAATILRMQGGAELESPEVWYFLGDALVVADHSWDAEARALLRRALEADPESPEAARAWFNVAIASNRLRDFEAERAAYGEALRLQWDRDKRAGIYLNRGEASMSLRDLRSAQKDYLTALATTTDSEIHALAAWGLAVALARSDDLPEALQYAFEAASMQFPGQGGNGAFVTAIDLPSVFFTPSHEIFYYRALGTMAIADRAGRGAERRAGFQRAVALWDEYLTAARREADHWTENAEHQRRYCERRVREK